MTLEKTYRDIINGRLVEITMIQHTESKIDYFESVRVKYLGAPDHEYILTKQDIQAILVLISRLPKEIRDVLFAMVKEEIL